MRLGAYCFMTMAGWVAITLVIWSNVSDNNLRWLFSGIGAVLCTCTLVILAILDDIEKKIK
jgi:hypothetical protein